jgi:hypothetical protein
MATLTSSAFAASVLIILLMATNAGVGSIFELIRDGMALVTSRLLMLPDQRETGDGMVEMGILPALLGMAGVAGSAKILAVWVIFFVAIHTLGRQRFKIGKGKCALMAFGTCQLRVRSKWIKRRLGMVKFLIYAFLAIMTGAAFGRICLGVGRHECFINPGMAISAVAGFKVFITGNMAGLTNKR